MKSKNWLYTTARLAGGLCIVLCANCGGSSTETPAAAASSRTKQEPLADDAWAKELTAAPDLKAAVDQAVGDRQGAGVIEDADGNRLVWAAFSNGDQRTDAMGVFRLCTKAAVCTVGTAHYTATGATLTDTSGKVLDHLAIGTPVLQEKFVNHNVSAPQTRLAPLDRSYVPVTDEKIAQANAGGFKHRRLVAFNTYGPQLGVSLQAVVTAAQAMGVFDSVDVIDFAKKSDILTILPQLTPLDVVVWLGAAVQESIGGVTKPTGFSVAQGVVGEELLYYKNSDKTQDFKTLLGAPALGGPGLVLLLGSGSVAVPSGDVSNLASALLSKPIRPVVGFQGKISPSDAIAATVTLLGQLGAGKDLDSALSAAGHGMGSTMDKSARALWKFPGKYTKMFAHDPSAAALKLYVKNDPVCFQNVPSCDPQGVATAAKVTGNKIPSEQLVSMSKQMQLECAPTITGPWIECHGTNAVIGQDFDLKGVILGTAQGDHIEFFVQGDASKTFQGITVIGDAELGKPDVGGGSSTLNFTGPAAASWYLDDQGRCCLANQPMLQSYDAKPSTLLIKN